MIMSSSKRHIIYMLMGSMSLMLPSMMSSTIVVSAHSMYRMISSSKQIMAAYATLAKDDIVKHM